MITFILGGARSGKSNLALKLASELTGKKAYIATAQPLDKEMIERIERHKKERHKEWITFEEPLNITALIKDIQNEYKVIILDCLTLWLSNIMHSNLDLTKEIDLLCSSLSAEHYSLFIVSNEVGLGIVPDNETARIFRDIAGYMNQKISAIADNVYFIVSGVPLKIK